MLRDQFSKEENPNNIFNWISSKNIDDMTRGQLVQKIGQMIFGLGDSIRVLFSTPKFRDLLGELLYVDSLGGVYPG